MDALRITLFGAVRIEHTENKHPEKLTATTCSLLSFLVLYRQRYHPRDVLTNLMWGELPPQRARNCLNTALWRLRQQIEPFGTPPGTYLLSNSAGELAFNCQSNYWLDIATFEEIVTRTLKTPLQELRAADLEEIEQAIHLYQGDLLESNYCEWVIQERERLRNLMLDARYYLLRYYQQMHRVSEALMHGSQIIASDPLREDAHRQVMRLYAESGQRSLAVRQYQICRQVLKSELNIEPMPETRNLLDAILTSDAPAPVESPSAQNEQKELQQAVARLHLAIDSVNAARLNLEEIISRYQ